MVHSDSHQTIENFFSKTDHISKSLPICEPHIEVSPILSILRPYQLETVKWMITRELQPTQLQLDDMSIELPLGGILADEMGLGKTVEMLACILGHPKEKKNNLEPTVTSSSLQPKLVIKNESVLGDESAIGNVSTSSEIPTFNTTTDQSISSFNASSTSLINTETKEEDVSALFTNEPMQVDSAHTSTPSIQIPKTSSCFLESSRQNLKRSISDYSDSPILKKRPALSSIKVNRLMKAEIKVLLKEYFEKFHRFYKRKHLSEDNSLSLMDTSFKITMLNRFYNFTNHTYSKQQTWAFLVTEFHVDDQQSIGYSILEKGMRKKSKKPNNVNDDLPGKSILQIMVHIDEFLTEKMMNKFKKEFDHMLAYSILRGPDDRMLISDENDVRCKCGSDKAQGKKITCHKCNTQQHLQCIGLEQTFDDFDNYLCPYCWMEKDSVDSSATLIIIPSTLSQQWKYEIKKHAVDCNLRVCIYRGVRKDYVLPNILANFDVVIVSFETLRAELNYASEVVNQNTRSLRHGKRYLLFASPLTCINWWRLCIDEAQMVESVNKVSEMVGHLKSTYRWAITGTPIGKSLKDLYGLTTFLGIEPFISSYHSFENLLSSEQTHLHTLFAHIMRRRTKNDVSSQLNLPELKVDLKLLSFTPVEGYFYQYTHSIAEKTFLQKIKTVNDIDQRLSVACRKTTENVLAPLLSLRQACVHPQACSNAIKKKHIINLSKTVRMDELLEQMIKKTKTECEDILRLYIMNIHGAAGVQISMFQYAQAVSLYRMVLSKVKEFELLTVDDFQVLHAKHNLYETALKDENIVLTPDEQNIPKQITELEQKYIERRRETVIVLLQNVEKYSTEIQNDLADFSLSSFDYWSKMLTTLDFEEMKTRISAELDKTNITLNNIKALLSTSNRLSNALKLWLKEIEDKRSLVYEFLEKITKSTSIDVLCHSAAACHLGQKNPKKTCLLCKMETWMTKYENLLFNGKSKTPGKGTEENENANPLNWQTSAYESVLNAILSHARAVYINNNDITLATNHLKVLSLLKREFRTIRATWTKQCELVQGYDEVAMAKRRSDAAMESNNEICFNDVFLQSQYDKHDAESVVAYSRLQSKIGSLHYLLNLKNQYSSHGAFTDCCPICRVSGDEKRGIMSCGHFTCYDCMLTLLKRSSRDASMMCPICRTKILTKNITFVHGGASKNSHTEEIRGNYSVKIIAVTLKVISLREQDPNAKILIFSTWDRVLDIVEQAFKENDIKFQRFCTGQKQKSCLESFKNNKNIAALLIPLRSGSKGLNLTEASHIIFTEPVLNIADEKQAIGRIYRLGQTKNMVIHKFVIKSTIEQHLLEMNEQLEKSNAKDSELTFKHLKELFIATTNDIENEALN